MMQGFDPNRQGLGGLGMGMLAAGQQVMQNEQLAQRQAMAESEQARAQQMADLQMRMYQAKLASDETQRQAVSGFVEGLPEGQRGLAAAFPEILAKQRAQSLYPEPVAPGAVITNVMPAQATEEAKKVGAFYGTDYTDMVKAGREAYVSNSKLERLDKLLDETYTGIGGAQVQAAKKLGGLIGMDMEGVGEAEAAQALAGELALQLRSPEGGAGMPGAMSDKDREFLESMVPDLATSKEGRKLMIETKKKLNKRNIEIAKMAREYRKAHGRLDEGFYDDLADYGDLNPMFDEGDLTKVRGGSSGDLNADEMAELERLRQAQGF